MKYNRLLISITSCWMYGVAVLLMMTACSDFLNVVPDNVPTIDHAFRNREEAQNYMYGCLSYMPDIGNYESDPAMLGSDEIMVPEIISVGGSTRMRSIQLGMQGVTSPVANYWSSKNSDVDNKYLSGGKHLWTGISDCNIFLTNIHKPYDLTQEERIRWTGEILFVKAYLHYWLFRQYGPIPLNKENFETDAPAEVVQQYRQPVDEVVNYIASLLDEAAGKLPLTVLDPTSELGRPDKCMALALKAQLYTLAASPLFNCNKDFADYKDNRDVPLFPQDESVKLSKWERAATALKAAIDAAHEAGYELYRFENVSSANAALAEPIRKMMQVRGAVTEKRELNRENIWGNQSTSYTNQTKLQRMCSPFQSNYFLDGGVGTRSYAPTFRMIEQFYTRNGLPIEYDKDWVGKDLFQLVVIPSSMSDLMINGQQTIQLHLDREPRFYGSIGFDRGRFFGFGNKKIDLLMRMGEMNGYQISERSSVTGYICTKLTHYANGTKDNSDKSYFDAKRYAYPVIRLADLYLMYAEVLNEAHTTPTDEVYEYIDKVRERVGLEGVVNTWTKYAVPGKENYPSTQAGMRDIIRRERMNELAFEGARFWDLRRWKLSKEYMNKPFRGLQVTMMNVTNFYTPAELSSVYQRRSPFENKDYFWPVKTSALLNNLNLLQSPGWE